LILRQILRAAGFSLFGSRALQWASNLGEILSGLPGCKDGMAERFYGMIARSGKLGGLGKLRKRPQGQRLAPNQPGDYLGQRVATSSKKVQLAPEEFIALAGKLDHYFGQALTDTRLKLISKRERYSHNSWTHNVSSFVKGQRSTNYLYIHPDDARACQLAEGDMAEVSANGRSIRVPVKLDRDFMPGTVSVPHGWGHQQSDGLRIARTTQGANVNILASDGPDSIEPISGMSQLNGIPVEVHPVS